jgi:regulator of sirC expression with transglutaminase-like and TPR domain
MLGNLRSIYLARQQWDQLTAVLERLCAVEPANGRHMQELAAVRYRVGDLRGAYVRLYAYLHHWPAAEDAAAVRSNLHHVEAAIAALN